MLKTRGGKGARILPKRMLPELAFPIELTCKTLFSKTPILPESKLPFRTDLYNVLALGLAGIPFTGSTDLSQLEAPRRRDAHGPPVGVRRAHRVGVPEHLLARLGVPTPARRRAGLPIISRAGQGPPGYRIDR